VTVKLCNPQSAMISGSFWLVQLFLGRTLKKLGSNVQSDSSYTGPKRTKIELDRKSGLVLQ